MPYVRRGFPCVCALVLAGCGLGGGDEASEQNPSITRADLALMVLPQEELGGLARRPQGGR